MSLEIEYLVQKEKFQDLIRAAEQDRLLQVAQAANNASLHRNLAAWMGIQMVKWGAKLQQYGSPAPTSAAHTEYLPN